MFFIRYLVGVSAIGERARPAALSRDSGGAPARHGCRSESRLMTPIVWGILRSAAGVLDLRYLTSGMGLGIWRPGGAYVRPHFPAISRDIRAPRFPDLIAAKGPRAGDPDLAFS